MAEPVKRSIIGGVAETAGAGVSNGLLGSLAGFFGGGTVGGLLGAAAVAAVGAAFGLVGGGLLAALPGGVGVFEGAGAGAAMLAKYGAMLGGGVGAISGALNGLVGGGIIGGIRGIIVKGNRINDDEQLIAGKGKTQQLQKMQENAAIHDQIAASAAQQGYNQGLQDAQAAMVAQLQQAALAQQAEQKSSFVERGAERRGKSPEELGAAKHADHAKASKEAAHAAQLG